MAEFNWVEALSRCSLQKIFKELEVGASSDVDVMNGIALKSGGPARFGVTKSATRFAVSTEKFGAVAAVEFVLADREIRVELPDGQNLIAKPALNGDGDCRLFVDGRELELWQFRQLALERLFFGGKPE